MQNAVKLSCLFLYEINFKAVIQVKQYNKINFNLIQLFFLVNKYRLKA